MAQPILPQNISVATPLPGVPSDPLKDAVEATVNKKFQEIDDFSKLSPPSEKQFEQERLKWDDLLKQVDAARERAEAISLPKLVEITSGKEERIQSILAKIPDSFKSDPQIKKEDFEKCCRELIDKPLDDQEILKGLELFNKFVSAGWAALIPSPDLPFIMPEPLPPAVPLKPIPPGMTFSQFLKQEGWIGLPKELDTTLSPVFAVHGPLKHLAKERGIRAEKGILLSGLPGTGKTTFARKLAEYLQRPPERIKMAAATELVSKWVGQTEENIRNLFEPAIKASKELGEESPLFVIVLDEFESLGQSRELADQGHELAKVGQLLSSMDGLFQLNNILVIAMTNHPRIIDKAFLRPGRFGTHIQMGLPTRQERKDMFKFYLRPLKDRWLAPDVDLNRLAELTAGFTGAEIAGLVQKTNNQVFARLIKLQEDGKLKPEEFHIHPDGVVKMADFMDVLGSRAPYRISQLFHKIISRCRPRK